MPSGTTSVRYRPQPAVRRLETSECRLSVGHRARHSPHRTITQPTASAAPRPGPALQCNSTRWRICGHRSLGTRHHTRTARWSTMRGADEDVRTRLGGGRALQESRRDPMATHPRSPRTRSSQHWPTTTSRFVLVGDSRVMPTAPQERPRTSIFAQPGTTPTSIGSGLGSRIFNRGGIDRNAPGRPRRQDDQTLRDRRMAHHRRRCRRPPRHPPQ